MLDSAMAAHRSGDIESAEKVYRAILDRQPEHPDALHLLGMIQHQNKVGREAFDLVSRAIEARSDAAEYHNTLGLIFRRAKEFERASQSFARAIRLKPDYRDAGKNLALVMCDMKRFADAVTILRHSLAEMPDDPVLLTALGRVYLLTGDFKRALLFFHDVLKIAPDHVEALNNIGVAFNLMGEAPSARLSFERALARDPSNVDTHYNYAQLLLLQGAYDDAWAHFEWRLQRQDYRCKFSVPMWRGEPLDGQTILVWCEQGLGDAIHFARYVLLVSELGGRVVVECQRPLRRLIEGVEGVSAVYDTGKTPSFDLHIPIMSLPKIFGTTVETIPADIPYVPVPKPSPIDAGGARLKVGLVWAGNPENARDQARSRRLSEFAPLAALDDVAYFSLQVGAGADDTPPPGLSIVNLMPEVKDFRDTAADMAGLDLIISVDSSSAHLAGAIGVPVWVLLDTVADWRWLTGRDDTPWYPTMRLFRRKTDWASLLADVAQALTHVQPRR